MNTFGESQFILRIFANLYQQNFIIKTLSLYVCPIHIHKMLKLLQYSEFLHLRETNFLNISVLWAIWCMVVTHHGFD